MKKLLLVLVILPLLSGCVGKGASDMENTANTAEMTEEQLLVLSAFEEFQQAMIDKDTKALTALVAEDKTFTHMSGKKQTKEEFFEEIENGTLNYYGYEIENPVIEIDGDRAVLTADTTLTAHVYGTYGTWTLRSVQHFVKENGKWIQCNE